MDFAQIEQLWTSNGGDPRWAPLMAGIALAESGGNPQALNDNANTGDFSVGLWQINYFGNLAESRSQRYGTAGQLQRDPNKQAAAAIDLFGNNAAGIGNWRNDPAYNAWVAAGMPQAPDAATVQGWMGGANGTFDPNAQYGIGPGAKIAGDGSGGSAATAGTCGSKGGGIGILGIHLFDACQIKAISGGLMIAAGGLVMVFGGVVVLAYGLSNTRIGKVATQAATKGPTGKVVKAVGSIGGSAGLENRRAKRDQESYEQYKQDRPDIEARNRRYRNEQRAAERAGYGRTDLFEVA